MRRILAPLVLLYAVSSCSAPEPEAAPVAPPAKPVVVAPTSPQLQQPKGDWIDWPLTSGDWVYRRDERGSIALFGSPNGDALVTLRCDTARGRIYLSRAGVLNGYGNGSGTMTIRSSSTLKQFPATSTGGNPPYVAVEIMPSDPILDAMIYSRGRIALETQPQLSIAIPNWAEIGRVVEDCR